MWCSILQMVGVSDDVSEYAMALRDTEDKLRRCPKRVRLGQAGGYWDRTVLHRTQGQYTWGPSYTRASYKGNLVLGMPQHFPLPLL